MRYVFLTPGMVVANWRTVWPAQELARRGWDTAYWHQGTAVPKMPRRSTTLVFQVVNAGWDKPDGSIMTGLDLIKRAVERQVRVIVQFDDDWTAIEEIEPRPMRRAPALIRDQIPEMCGLAERVIVATPRLREVYGQFHHDVRVAENYLPQSIIDIPRRESREMATWMGTMDVHGRDWWPVMPFAPRLPPLRLVGAGEKSARVLRHFGAPYVEATDPIIEPVEFYSSIGEAKTAIIPILGEGQSIFNLGKSWIKPMEFIARGVAPVAQVHPEYERLAERVGDALELASDPETLVDRTVVAFHRPPRADLQQRLIDSRTTMEQSGGDAWEAALAA